jgi:hypothetical protein
MKIAFATFTALALVGVPTSASAAGSPAKTAAASGAHGFDFEFGSWRVHHRTRRVSGRDEWNEFDGTCVTRPLMNGAGNVEDHTFNKPGMTTHGVALRAFDPKTSEWAIWWIDGRVPHGPLDPPVKGRFENGVGTFYSDGVVDGKTTRTRFIWSQITASSARWEQAYSADGGKTWETNWIMAFERVSL